MIAQARQSAPDLTVDFRVGAGEDLDESEGFDVVFCNSTLQWFSDPPQVLANCRRHCGEAGDWACSAAGGLLPCLQARHGGVDADSVTADTYRRFQSRGFPGYRGPTRKLCRAAGLRSGSAAWSRRRKMHAGGVMRRFESGAAAGYLNPEHYQGGCTAGYLRRRASGLVRRSVRWWSRRPGCARFSPALLAGNET